MEETFEELEEDMGKVLCVLPGWEEDELSGPSLDDPSEMVSIPITPAEEFGMAEFGGMGNMTEEEMKEAMIKAGYILEGVEDVDDDEDDDGEEPDVDQILAKIKGMQVAEQAKDKEKKQKKKDKKKKASADEALPEDLKGQKLTSGAVVEELD